MRNRSGLIALLAISDSVALFVAACAMPALALRPLPATGVPTPASLLAPQTWTGIEFVLRGWAGVPAAELVWLVNPLLVCAWLALGMRRWRAALIIALTALASAASVIGRETLLVAGDGGATTLLVEGALIGYYLWLASAGLAALGALVGWVATQRATPAATPAHAPGPA